MNATLETRRERLRTSIARDQAELQAALRDLRTATSARPAVEERIARRPAPWLVGAFAIGLWLATGD